MTTRAKLQELGLDALREMASRVGVDHDGLQKSKLIGSILDSDSFDASMVPEPTQAEANGETGVTESRERGADRTDTRSGRQEESQRRGPERQGGRGGQGGQGGHDGQGNRSRSRRRRRGPQEPIDESELEVREGILDILPEGYGFLRCSGYLPGEKDVYMAANHIRKNGLRRGDICTGPIRPARAQEKFPALVRVVTVNGMEPENTKHRVSFDNLRPRYPEHRLGL